MRLTDDQIKMARITYTKVVQDDFILDLIDTIEALQQENERLADETIKLMRESAQNSMRAESLTAERDELAGRLMLLNDGIKQVIKWLTPHPSDGSRAVEKARLHLITLIGGKEDGK